MEINGERMGREAASSIVLEVDVASVERGMFGLFRWRLRVAMLLFWLAAKVLRFEVRITSSNKGE